jgi:hypothetical protein
VPEPKTGKNRVHLDFTVDNVDQAVARILELGEPNKKSASRAAGRLWPTMTATNSASPPLPERPQDVACPCERFGVSGANSVSPRLEKTVFDAWVGRAT